MLLIDPVCALALVRLEGLDGVPGLLHRPGHEAPGGGAVRINVAIQTDDATNRDLRAQIPPRFPPGAPL
jgi:hypothetical protein